MKVAIIPARGGSKRIHKKNIKLFCGEPIINYSIRTAKESGIFDSIVVSSDDEEILEISRKCGVDTIVRPCELSGDEVATLPVISHSVLSLGLKEKDLVCCIYPTAPLLEVSYILQALDALLKNPSKNYAFSVVEFDSSPFRGFEITDDVIKMLFPQYQLFRSQDLKKVYHDAGAFYFGFAQSFLEEKAIFSSDSIPIILPKMIVQDIDTLDDWHLAEIKYQLKHSK